MHKEFKEIRDLYGIGEENYGVPEKEIAEAEEKLSVRLPQVLKDYYLQLGGHEAINQTQDSLLLPSQLYFSEDGHLIFYAENQAVAVWGIKKADLTQENPPVYMTYDEEEWTDDNNLYDFFVAAAYLQSIFAFPFNANAIDVAPETIRKVKENHREVMFNTRLWSVEFHQNDSEEILALLKSEEQTDLFVAAKTLTRLEQLDNELETDWDYYSPEDE